jgi:hypothetical protein
MTDDQSHFFYVEYFALLIPIGTAIGPRASPKARQKA